MKTKIFIVLLVISSLAGFSSISNSALFNGHDYQIVSFSGNWDEATAHMQSTLGFGYHLATITSAEEQSFIYELIEDDTKQYWLGGFQNPLNTTDAGAGWTWVNGEGLFWDNGPVGGAYTNWDTRDEPEEPNDYFGPGSEQYLSIYLLGFWNDSSQRAVDNDGIGGYVAEAVPIPGAAWLLGSGLFGLVFLRRRMKN